MKEATEKKELLSNSSIFWMGVCIWALIVSNYYLFDYYEYYLSFEHTKDCTFLDSDWECKSPKHDEVDTWREFASIMAICVDATIGLLAFIVGVMASIEKFNNWLNKQ